MKKFANSGFGILAFTIIPLFISLFVDGKTLIENIHKLINYMINIDSKYIPYIIALILSLIILLVLLYNKKKKEHFQILITLIEKAEDIYYMEIDDLIAKFKTYTIGNNEEHNKIIDALNESIKGSVENIKNGIFTPKEAKAEIGKDESVKIGFEANKQNIEKKRNELAEFIKTFKQTDNL